MQVTVKAYAKINLMLDILSVLPDGYHDLFMVMQSVGIYDTVTVKKTDTKNIKITCDVPAIPVGESNIALRFFQPLLLFFQSLDFFMPCFHTKIPRYHLLLIQYYIPKLSEIAETVRNLQKI